jgi:YD repeat-containing protein
MKNIFNTEENLNLFNKNGIKVYEYFKNLNGFSYERTYDSNGKLLTYKDSDGFSYECTYDSNGNELTYKDSNGYSYEYTRDLQGNELTYKDSDGVRRGFDKTYTFEEVEFIKRAVEYYWQDWNQGHPDNKNDLKLTKQILSK